MTLNPIKRPRATEDRLEKIREEARRTGTVEGRGMAIAGGPLPQVRDPNVAYYGLPILKAPVWTWQIGLYFFIGGTAGMSGVIALAGVLTGEPFALVRAALTMAFAGAAISPLLLIWDLGRPARFLNMLRVFKWRSAMSMGVWTLVAFSGFATLALLMTLVYPFAPGAEHPPIVVRALLLILVAGTAIFGALLATYTGVLLGATAVPIWSAHHRLLPFHFGIVALGSAAAILELAGFRVASLQAIGVTVTAIETAVSVWLEWGGRHDVAAHTLHQGPAGRLLRSSELLTGPVPLLLRLLGWVPIAAMCFVLGAVASRYGWLLAGHASAQDPEETIRAQRPLNVPLGTS